MRPVLTPVFLGSLSRRRLTTAFSLIAVVLGVALGMAVQAVHTAALSEFSRGVRTVAGEADLRIVGPRNGFDETVYPLVAALPEVAAASPVVEATTRVAGQEQALQIAGVDLFAAAGITPALLARPSAGSDRLSVLGEDRIFLSDAARVQLGATPGSELSLRAGIHLVRVVVGGDIPAAAENSRLAIMDIAAVQRQFDRLTRLTRIDVRATNGVSLETAKRAVQAVLPAGVVVETPEVAENQAALLSRAYRVNLTMLAAMALLTGGFLVFSAQALSVVRRRSEFAFLRAIGLSRQRLLVWLLGEGAAVGLVGGVLGVALGYAVAWALLELLGGDLGAGYFAGLRPRLEFAPIASLTYGTLGILAGIAGAWWPAREAATVPPAQALKAGDDASIPVGHGHPRIGLALLGVGIIACWLPPLGDLPVGGYAAIACLLGGGVLLLPVFAAALARRLPNALSVPARLAKARLEAAPGHAVVAAAGVLTSVALSVAMAIMVASFRDSVDAWLHQLLPADLYVRAGAVETGTTLDGETQARIASTPGVDAVSFTRHESLRLSPEHPPAALIARPLSTDGRELPVVDRAPPESDPSAVPVWISEAMKDLYGWRPGQRVELPIAGHAAPVRVAGVWRDYARQTGAVMINLTDYRRLSDDRLANDAAITLAPGHGAADVAARVAATAAPGTLQIAYPGEIRAISLRIFDRTFAVTYLLEAAAVAIGLAGVAASFAALAAARRKEFGMLRHLGVTRSQIAWMLAQEGALAAGAGVLGGLAVGGATGLVLIEVVNRQSFHWSMDLHVPWVSLAVFAGVLIALAALGAVVAGRAAMRQEAVLAVREDW